MKLQNYGVENLFRDNKWSNISRYILVL